MRRLVIIAAVLFVAFAPSVAAAASASPVVVVLPVDGAASEPARAGMAEALRTGVNDSGVGTAQAKKATAQALDAAKALGIVCTADKADCAMKLGGLAGGDVVVHASLDAKGLILALEAYDVVRGKELGHASVTLDADAKKHPAQVRQAVIHAVAPERERSFIALTVKQSGAAVVVDGAPRGVSPLAAPIAVMPGKHEVYVALKGFESASEKFDVAMGETSKLDVELKPGDAGLAVKLPDAPAPVDDAKPADKPAEAAPKKFVRIAVYQIEATGIEPRQAKIVTEAVLLELRKLQGVTVVGLDEIKAMLDLEANRQLLGCNADSSCLAEIADALGADIVVVGSAGVVGDGTVFGLKRLDPKTAQAKQVSKHLARENGEELLAAVGPSVQELFPELVLKPGQKRGVPAELALRINPPPLPPWAFWTTTAAAGAAGVFTAGAGVLNLNALQTYQVQGSPAHGDARGDELKQTEVQIFNTALGFWIGVGVTSVAGAAAGVEALFVDWRGYGDTGEAAE